MFRVLIVDDEPIAVESVVYMIKKNFSEIEIVGSSRSGKDAIEKAYHLHPDIIIMDINMPGINGLEAIKQIRGVDQGVSFIVISAFDYFDYAVEAVALGVDEYLLKPVKEAKFSQTLSKTLDNIRNKRISMQKNLEQQERMEMIIPILETGFMNSLCLYGDNSLELQNYCELFGSPKPDGYVMALEFGQKHQRKIENKIGAGVQGEKMYGEYKKIIKAYSNAIVGPIMLNRIIVYVFEENVDDNFEQKANSVLTAQRILDRASKIYPDIYVGIGRHHTSISDAKKSYQEALYALSILTGDKEEEGINQLLHVDDILEKVEYTESDYERQIEEEIYTRVVEKDITRVQIAFESIYNRMSSDVNMSFPSVKNRMIGLVMGFGTRWENVIGDYYEVLKRIINAGDRDTLYQICKQFIQEALDKIASGRQNKVNSIIEKANKYIEENYDKDLPLEEVAREVNLSPYYFSRFYKEESGINFSDKIVNVRIDKAKELLRKEEYSVKDVCYMVGYMEPNYFSKIFKKVTGVTASEYKKMFGS
ncbi:MAG: response regulator [Anaerocolumna sp.]|jgi:two-component system response regulator YesN|nr:response regulator [Anaerocolumna sp.]